jgi:hypothetical protein
MEQLPNRVHSTHNKDKISEMTIVYLRPYMPLPDGCEKHLAVMIFILSKKVDLSFCPFPNHFIIAFEVLDPVGFGVVGLAVTVGLELVGDPVGLALVGDPVGLIVGLPVGPELVGDPVGPALVGDPVGPVGVPVGVEVCSFEDFDFFEDPKPDFNSPVRTSCPWSCLFCASVP